MLYWGSLRMEKWVALLRSLIKISKKEIQVIWLVSIYMCFSLFQCFVCLCTCRRTCVWVHVHLCAHVWRDQKSSRGSFLKHSFPCLTKPGLALHWYSTTKLCGLWHPTESSFISFQLWDYSCAFTLLRSFLNVGSRGQNQVSVISQRAPLPTELSPYPSVMFLKK